MALALPPRPPSGLLAAAIRFVACGVAEVRSTASTITKGGSIRRPEGKGHGILDPKSKIIHLIEIVAAN